MAALATEGVHALGHGRYVEAATYDGNEKVSGVIVRPDEVEIHVVASWPLPKPIPEIAGSIRDRLGSEAGQRKTTVVFENLEVGTDEDL